MMKIMCFLKRKAGMSSAAFRDYYEQKHAPLIERHLPYYQEFKRNFFAETQDYSPGHMDNRVEDELGFDVVTELTFTSRADYEKLEAALSDPEIGAIVTADEENLFDRSKMRVFIMEEAASTPRG